MSRYDPAALVARIESHLAGEESAGAPLDGLAAGGGQEETPVIRALGMEALPTMRRHYDVAHPPHRTRFARVKKLWLMLLRPLAGRQSTFNYQTLASIEMLAHSFDGLQRALAEQRTVWEAERQRSEAEVATLRRKLDRLARTVDEQQLAASGAVAMAGEARVEGGARPQRPQTVVAERALERAYLQFQRRFRGLEGDIRERQRRYVHLLRKRLPEPTAKVLDVACGDGIFLGLLRDAGFDAQGVDLNREMAAEGLERGLPITVADAMEFLHAAPASSYDAVTAFQFVEHLPPVALMEFLTGVERVLRPGGVLVVETLNPHTLMAHKWFQMDLTHERLIFPEMLQLLAEAAGLEYETHKGIHPVAEHERLAVGGEGAGAVNVARLNAVLFGEQDYYLVARKPGE